MANIVEETPAEPTGTGQWRQFAVAYMRSPVAVLGLIMLLTIVFLALAAPWITPQDPYNQLELNVLDALKPPGSKSGFSDLTFALGSDGFGRDMLSSMIWGLRISLGIGIGCGVLALMLGTTVGLIAAFYGGKVDSFVMRVVDLKLSFPGILIALIFLAVFGRGTVNLVIALVITQWASFARVARGAALAEKNKEYVQSATLMGFSRTRIIFRHILPNCLPPLMVLAAIEVADVILAEATLSFLGLGLPITEPSLGLLVAGGFDYMLSGKFWISFFPGVVLFLTVLSFNLVGDHLREIINPRRRR